MCSSDLHLLHLRERAHVLNIPRYKSQLFGCVPGGTNRNFESYGHKIGPLTDYQKAVLCDPQTSGGLLIAVKAESEAEILEIAKKAGIELSEVGVLKPHQEGVLVEVE